MTDPTPAPLPIGDLAFFDSKVPGVTAANYWITVTHTVEAAGAAVSTDTLQAVQEVVVSAPQFTLDPDEIVARHPPPASTGQYGEQLAHVVLREPALPWERAVAGGADPVQPWLALLVLAAEEILGGETSPTGASTATVDEFLHTVDDVYRPKATREDDVDPASAMSYIRLSPAVFQAVMPRLAELRFLAHCRQANVGDKAAQGLDPDGFFAVVAANRFPLAAPAGTGATRNIVHLVSVEGVEALLVDAPDFGSHTSVALASLASWTFQCQADQPLDFRGLVAGFVASESPDGKADPSRLALTLPPLDLPQPPSAAQAEAAARIGLGFVPLAYHARTGEESFAWYRGPLVPTVTQPLGASGPFLTADAAMAYQPAHGVFDLSLAAAWEAGRAAALADTAFGQRLLDFRRRGHALTDQLLHRLESVYFLSQDQIASLSTDTAVEDELLSVLDGALVDSLGSAGTTAVPARAASAPAPAPTDPRAAVAAFLADPEVQGMVAELVKDDLAGVAEWLARLLLLTPLPFHLLVPDAGMLPPESLRFFYVDDNWTGALLDGAMSLGLESSRQTFFQAMTRDVLRQAVNEAARDLRASITGVDPPAAEAEANVVSGMLIRSTLVTGWPTLAVRPYLAQGQMLRILRMEHLSPTVLLCLFDGVPAWVEISEPQEGLVLGVDDDGRVNLRNAIPPAGPSATALGAQIGTPVAVYDPKGQKQLCARAVGSRTLDIGALVAAVQAALSKAGGMPPGEMGPAQLALQMVKSPEAIIFTSLST